MFLRDLYFKLRYGRLPKSARVGIIGERLTAGYYRRQGYRVIERNRHIGKLEIDLIVRNKTDVVFVEVKTRTSDGDASYSRPADAVNRDKRTRTVNASKIWLSEHPEARGLQPRIDVVEVYLNPDETLLRMEPFRDAVRPGYQ